MPEVRYTEQFIEDAAAIRLESKRLEVRRRVGLLSDFPGMGSPNLPESIARRYGPSVRKLAVDPFIVVYEVNEEAGTVDVLGLVHQRSAW